MLTDKCHFLTYKNETKRLNKTNNCESSTGIDFEFKIFKNDCFGSAGIDKMNIIELELSFEVGL